jgi:hypothetical protein
MLPMPTAPKQRGSQRCQRAAQTATAATADNTEAMQKPMLPTPPLLLMSPMSPTLKQRCQRAANTTNDAANTANAEGNTANAEANAANTANGQDKVSKTIPCCPHLDCWPHFPFRHFCCSTSCFILLLRQLFICLLLDLLLFLTVPLLASKQWLNSFAAAPTRAFVLAAPAVHHDAACLLLRPLLFSPVPLPAHSALPFCSACCSACCSASSLAAGSSVHLLLAPSCLLIQSNAESPALVSQGSRSGKLLSGSDAALLVGKNNVQPIAVLSSCFAHLATKLSRLVCLMPS